MTAKREMTKHVVDVFFLNQKINIVSLS